MNITKRETIHLMFLAYLTLLTALTISGVAIYYSVSGLAAIFSAAVIPIIIMGGTLEVAKLVTAVWLHRSWKHSTWWLKGYLSIAVLVLMFITSIGIFGFLSKAHDTASGASAEAIALVNRVDSQIAREENRIQILQQRISGISDGAPIDNNLAIQQQQDLISGARDAVQNDIAYNQSQITAINTRLDTDLAALERSRATDIQVQTDRLAALDQAVNDLRSRGVQTVETDNGGVFRGANVDVIDNNARADALLQQQQPERDRIQENINRINAEARDRESTLRTQARTSVNAAQANINRYRAQTQTSVDNATAEMNRLREQTITSQDQNLAQIDEWQTQIDGIYETISQLREEKFDAEEQVRSVEREVGPIRYIAEFFSNEQADATMLERAVSWLIVIIIFVFDPLAVLLLIASQYTFARYGKKHFLESDPEPTPTDNSPEPKFKETDPNKFDIVGETELDLDFSNIKPSIEEVREALKKWHEDQENAKKVSAENGPVSESESEPDVFTEGDFPVVDAPIPNAVTDTPIPDDPNRGAPFNWKVDQAKKNQFTYQKVKGSDYLIDDEGKSIHKEALKTIHPEIFLNINDSKASSTSFGTQFPQIAEKGDIFVRVDQMPNKVYKFEGKSWIEVEKKNSDTYLYDEEYIKYLISQIQTGNYDVDLLSDSERLQIEEYLKKENG